MVQPGFHALLLHPEWDRGEKLRGRHLAGPVIRGPMPHLHGALGYRVEHLQGGHQFTAGKHRDVQPAVAHDADVFGKHFRRFLEYREIRRPGGHHLPAIDLAGIDSRIRRFFWTTTATGVQHSGEQKK